MSVIGLDIGTTGCKAMLFSEEWEILGQASREYGILTPQPGWYEQDAELVWNQALTCLHEALSQNTGSAPTALALSVQGEATIPVDTKGHPLRPAILGMDTRTSPPAPEPSRTSPAVTDTAPPDAEPPPTPTSRSMSPPAPPEEPAPLDTRTEPPAPDCDVPADTDTEPPTDDASAAD